MATGRIESGRVDIRAPGSSPMQRVGVGEVNFIGPRAEAQGAAAEELAAGVEGFGGEERVHGRTANGRIRGSAEL